LQPGPPNPISQLPLELREQIYEYALPQPKPATYHTRYGNYLTLGYFPLDFSRYHLKKVAPQTFLPALLYVNSQYRGEALRIFLKTNTIRVEADYSADKFLEWLKDMEQFSNVHALDLPFFGHSHLGRSAQELLLQCPNLKHLVMNFSRERISETREVTGRSRRRSRSWDRDRPSGFDDDVAISMENSSIEINWRVKLERIRDLPSLVSLTLVLHDPSKRSHTKEDLAKLKEWFDMSFNGRVKVTTDVRSGYDIDEEQKIDNT
jgi:hypothetical protein